MSLSMLRVLRLRRTMTMKARKVTIMRMRQNTQQKKPAKTSTAISMLALSKSFRICYISPATDHALDTVNLTKLILKLSLAKPLRGTTMFACESAFYS
jgi:hypothetical protein